VPANDSSGTKKVTRSDKLDDKLSDKPTADADLALVVKIWPGLPLAIRSAIVAIVGSSNDL